MNAGSSTEPCSILQRVSGIPSRSRSHRLVATESASKSNEITRAASSRHAASEKSPLPQPMSRNDWPERFSSASRSRSDWTAFAIRASLSDTSTKCFQLAPKP